MNCDLIVLTWDGMGGWPACYQADEHPAFAPLLFDFTGMAAAPENWQGGFLSRKCEGKGDVFREVYEHLLQTGQAYRLVSLWDDDVEVRTSQINALLDLGPRFELDLFAPALTNDSYFAFPFTLRRDDGPWHAAPFIEVMMPFYPYDLFMAAGEFYGESISAYGLDHFVMGTFQKIMGYDRIGVIDRVSVRHTRPLVSNTRTFRTGKNAWQERARCRELMMGHVARVRPDLIGSSWYMNCFANPGGPAKFWGPWLVWPWLALKGAVARRKGAAA